jgi:guanine deaminase
VSESHPAGIGLLDFFDLDLKADPSEEWWTEAVEKWWCNGDERNRSGMWVQGKELSLLPG